MLGYGYGIDAIRDGGRGADTIMILLQFDLGAARQEVHKSGQPAPWSSFKNIFGIFGL